MEDEKSIDDMTTEELEAEFKTLGVTPEPIQEDTVDLEGTTDSNTTEATETVPGDTTEAPEDFVFEEEKYKEKTSEELLKEMKKISIQNYHKEKMIQRQALEIGRVRKQEVDLRRKEQEAEALLTKLIEKENTEDMQPEEFEQHIVAKHKATNDMQHSKAELAALRNEEWLRSLYPDFEELIANEVPKIIKQDLKDRGREAEFEVFNQIFKSGNWRYEDPTQLNFVLTRAKEQKVIRLKDERIKQLEEAYKKAINEPDSLGRKLGQVSTQSRVIPKASSSENLAVNNVRELTDAELTAMLKKFK